MLAGIAQGPGLPNLSCLGLLADRILLNIDARMGKHHRLIMSNLLHPKVFPILTMRSLVVYKEVIRMTIQAEQQICTPHVGRYLLPDEGGRCL